MDQPIIAVVVEMESGREAFQCEGQHTKCGLSLATTTSLKQRGNHQGLPLYLLLAK